MKKALFDELVDSIREAGRIHRGEAKASRTFVFEPEDVRQIREKLHKSQSEFARMIGVSVATLQNWEQGRRQPESGTSATRGCIQSAEGCGKGIGGGITSERLTLV